jgi:hypothetical protein
VHGPEHKPIEVAHASADATRLPAADAAAWHAGEHAFRSSLAQGSVSSACAIPRAIGALAISSPRRRQSMPKVGGAQNANIFRLLLSRAINPVSSLANDDCLARASDSRWNPRLVYRAALPSHVASNKCGNGLDCPHARALGSSGGVSRRNWSIVG